MPPSVQDAERLARESYGKVLAFAIRRCASAGPSLPLLRALDAALRVWPRDGVPDAPEAWIIDAALAPHAPSASGVAHPTSGDGEVRAALDEARELALRGELEDERLGLLLACCAPDLAPPQHAPLILHFVQGRGLEWIAAALGCDAIEVASTVEQGARLLENTRATWAPPPSGQLAEGGVSLVLQAIYRVYGGGWEDIVLPENSDLHPSHDGIELCRVLVRLLPEEREVLALMAIVLHCEARSAARRDADGAFVPILAQDPARWNARLIEAANRWLLAASRTEGAGPLQLEAAVQSAYALRAVAGGTDWPSVTSLCEGVTRVAPTTAARIALAAAAAEARSPELAFEVLRSLPEADREQHASYWALSASLLDRQGRSTEARPAYARALALTRNASARRYLDEKLARLTGR